MSQSTDSWMPSESDEPEVESKVSWDEISPESLRHSALSAEIEETTEADEDLGAVGMAWFEIILGTLLGLASMILLWYWSDGGLGPVVAAPAALMGTPLVMTKRRDLRYLGYGTLASIPIALVFGVLLWYLTLF